MATSWGGFARLDLDGNQICFNRFDDESVVRLTDGSIEAICGNLDHDKALVDEGIVIPKGKLLLQPTPEELDILLPFIGFEETPDDTFTPTDDITTMPLPFKLDRVATSNVDDLGNAYVDKAIFRGQKGIKPMSLELHLIFDQIVALADSSWAGSGLTNTAPYPFHRAVLNLEGGAKSFRSFAYIVDNHLIWEHENNRAPTNFQFGDDGRTHHLGVDTPYTSNETVLLSNPIASVAGAAGSLVYTRGTQSTSFAFTNLKAEVTPPGIMKEEVRLNTYYKSYANGATKPVIITHDATV